MKAQHQKWSCSSLNLEAPGYRALNKPKLVFDRSELITKGDHVRILSIPAYPWEDTEWPVFIERKNKINKDWSNRGCIEISFSPVSAHLGLFRSNETVVAHEPAASLNYSTKTEGRIYGKENAKISWTHLRPSFLLWRHCNATKKKTCVQKE